MSVITAGNTSYQNFFQKFYSSNRDASRSANRKTISNANLLAADSAALKKVSKNLQELSYDKDNGEEIYQNMKAFVESYNNLLESAGNCTSSSGELERTMKKLKNYIKDNQDDLESLGLKVSSTGKLTLDKEDLLSCTPKKIGKIFSSSNTVSSSIISYTTKINRLSKPLIQAEAVEKNRLAQESLANLPVTTSTMTANKIDFMA